MRFFKLHPLVPGCLSPGDLDPDARRGLPQEKTLPTPREVLRRFNPHLVGFGILDPAASHPAVHSCAADGEEACSRHFGYEEGV